MLLCICSSEVNYERRKLYCLACDKLCFESHLSALFLTARTCPGCGVWFLTVIGTWGCFGGCPPWTCSFWVVLKRRPCPQHPWEGRSRLPAGSPALPFDLMAEQCPSSGRSPALPLLPCLRDCPCVSLCPLQRAWGDRSQPPFLRAGWWMCPGHLGTEACRSHGAAGAPAPSPCARPTPPRLWGQKGLGGSLNVLQNPILGRQQHAS